MTFAYGLNEDTMVAVNEVMPVVNQPFTAHEMTFAYGLNEDTMVAVNEVMPVS